MKIFLLMLILAPSLGWSQDVPDARIYFSHDGIHWTHRDKGLPKDVVVYKQLVNEGKIFIGTKSHGIFKLDDQMWIPVGQNALPQGRISAMISHNHQVVVSIDGSGLYASPDNGQSWKPLGSEQRPTDRIRSLYALQDILIAGGDAGIYVYAKAKWTTAYQGVQVNALIHFNNHLYAAVHNAILSSPDLGKTWRSVWRHSTTVDFAIQEKKLVGMLPDGDVVVLLDHDVWLDVTPFLRSKHILKVTAESPAILRQNFHGQFIRHAQFYPLIKLSKDVVGMMLIDTPEGLMLVTGPRGC